MLQILAPALLASASAQAPVELKVWHAYRGDEAAALESTLEEWDEAHDGVTVATLAIPFDTFANKLEAAAPRGNGPDLFIAAHERIGDWANSGLVEPVASLPEGLHPTTIDALTFEGAVYGVPLAYKCIGLFYNKALLDGPPETTTELLGLVTPDGGFPFAYRATDAYFHAAWMHAFGGGVFQDDAVALDQPGNAEALDFARSLIARGLVPDEPTGALVTQLFNEGLTPVVINGPWFIGEIDEGVDYGVAPLPYVDEAGAPAAPFLTVEAALVSAHAAHPEPAAALAAHLASPEVATRRAIEGRQSVATLAAYEDPRVAGDPVIGAFRQQLDAAVPMPNRPEMAATWEPMAEYLRRVTRGSMEGEVAVRLAQEAYEVVARPPPEPRDPRPLMGFLGLALLAGAAWVLRGALRAKAEIAEHRFAYATVLPAALAMGLLVVVPFVVGAGVSLFAHRDGQFTFVGLANFLDIVLARDWSVTNPKSFWFTLGVTILWTATNVFAHVGIGIALAMLLREPWLRLRGVYRVLLILPWAVPNYITALIWKGMFNRQFGAINGLLEMVGVEPVSWFSKFSTAFTANLVTNTWLGFPFMMVVTLGALQAIPRDLEQAAEVDGASGWQRFRHVTLPLLKPALLPAVVLGSVWTFNMFNIIYLVSAGEPDASTEILISEAYKWAFSRGSRYGYAAAYSVLIFGVLLLYSKGSNRLLGQKVL